MKSRFKTKIASNIKLIKLINNGGEGGVWLVEACNKNKNKYALKIYNNNSQYRIKRELEVKTRLKHHNNILLPLELVNDTRYNRSCILYNYINGIDMHNFYDITQHLDLTKKQLFLENKFLSLWCALAKCHEHNICHRDIKPSNILWKRGNINDNLKNDFCYDDKLILADFGACYFDNNNIRIRSPTQLYAAPENNFDGKRLCYDKRCDIWSLSLSWLAIIFGDNVIYSHHNNYGELLRKHGYLYLKKELPYIFNNLDVKTKSIIKSTLVPHPNDRATAKEVCDMLA
jgi:serine/threonine protein kinase